jgi:hypothetical protein
MKPQVRPARSEGESPVETRALSGRKCWWGCWRSPFAAFCRRSPPKRPPGKCWERSRMPRLGLPGVNPALGLSDHWQLGRGAIASGLARPLIEDNDAMVGSREPPPGCLAGQWAFSRAAAPFLVSASARSCGLWPSPVPRTPRMIRSIRSRSAMPCSRWGNAAICRNPGGSTRAR